MNDLSALAMTDYSDIERCQEEMGKEAFGAYRDKVYTRLMRMTAGDIIDVQKIVRRENLEVFIKVVCLFISEGNGDYSFSSNFNTVKRNG